MRRSVLNLALVFSLLAVPALAEGGGGGEGAGPGGVAPPAAAPAAAPAPGRREGASGTTRLPGGSTLTLSDDRPREAKVVTADGKEYTGTHIRTSRNSSTGITSIWLRNADGTRTGIHIDKQGNQSVTQHKR